MQNEALDFIQEITTAMNQTQDPDDILDQILRACIHLSHAEGGSIMLLDSNKKRLEMRASYGITIDTKNYSQSIEEGVTGWVARSGKPRIVNDSSSEDDYLAVSQDYVSELAVPLIEKEKVFGVLSVDSSKTKAFHSEHERYLGILANLVSKIFINLRDTRLLKMRDHFHRILIDISRVATSSMDLDEVFREFMSYTETAFRMHKSLLLLYNAKQDRLEIASAVGFDYDDLDGVVYTPGEGIVGKVFSNKSPVYIPDANKNPEFLNRLNVIPDDEKSGFFCCPVFVGKDPIGVFSTFSHPQSDLSTDHIIEFFSIIASFISRAVTIQQLIKEEKRVIAFENLKLKQELSGKYKFGNLIGRADITEKLFEKVQIVADSRATVLFTGESGTGKELFASAIHYNSPRRDGPFIKINCAAIPDTLLESELFGHKKGAFTGAVSDKKGKFLLAHGGSIFLDEIGEMDLNLQSKMLRVLQEREIEPVGGIVRKVDIRVIAATNSDLEEKIRRKVFREDLYYRLNVISLKIPPLRERREDILPLIFHFMKKYNKENSKKIGDISADAIALLENYSWPGNIRQLENMIERAIVMSQHDKLQVDDFMELMSSLNPVESGVSKKDTDMIQPKIYSDDSSSNSKDLLDVFIADTTKKYEKNNIDDINAKAGIFKYIINLVEKKMILLALKQFRYTKVKAARYLGINRNTLDNKIKELEIEY